MFLSEKVTRQEFGHKLTTTIMQAIQHLNSDQKEVRYHFDQANEGISLTLQGNSLLANIRPLQDLPLYKLNLDNTKVKDVNQLKGIPLEWLSLAETEVIDISPLEDKKLTLKWLNLSGTQVSNISALKNLKLIYIDLSNSKVRDLSPLLNMKLKDPK